MENRKMGRAVGGGYVHEIKTLAVYKPGSHLEAVSLWPFLDQVAD